MLIADQFAGQFAPRSEDWFGAGLRIVPFVHGVVFGLVLRTAAALCCLLHCAVESPNGWPCQNAKREPSRPVKYYEARRRAAWSTLLDPGTGRIQIPGSIRSGETRGLYYRFTPITKDVRGGTRGQGPCRAAGGAGGSGRGNMSLNPTSSQSLTFLFIFTHLTVQFFYYELVCHVAAALGICTDHWVSVCVAIWNLVKYLSLLYV